MNYIIERREDNYYHHSYFYQSKNEKGQTIRCDLIQSDWEKNEFNFSFCIKNKRKLPFPKNQVTGRDGIKSLIWAYRCLLDSIKFLKQQYPHSTLYVFGDTQRKQKIYERYLLPLGFKSKKDKIKELYLKII